MNAAETYIFLIDDDEIQNIINARIFELINPEIRVKAFQDAADAVQELLGGKDQPDIIFLDLNMPTTSGWHFLEEFEKLELQIPLIVLTSSINENDRRKALNCCCVFRYESKPVTRQFMAQLLEDVLK